MPLMSMRLAVACLLSCWSLSGLLFLSDRWASGPSGKHRSTEILASRHAQKEMGPTNGPTTIIVMRHCGRAESMSNIHPTMRSFFGWGNKADDYSDKPWPKFPAAAYNCLKRGSAMIEAQGAWYRKEGGLPEPIQGIADTQSRTMDSMHSFVNGFNGTIGKTITHLPYGPAKTADCNSAIPDKLTRVNDAKQFRLDNPPPKGYSQDLQMLYDAMGHGLRDWRGNGCYENGFLTFPYPIGTCQAAGNLADDALAEWVGGMEVLWGRIQASDIPKIVNLHSYHYLLWWGPKLMARLYGASMQKAISTKLLEGVKGTTIYFGHDSDIMMLKSVLGVSWDPMPFAAVNDTSPGSMLRFDMKDGKVNISFWHVKNFSYADGAMRSIPVRSNIPVLEVSNILVDGPLQSCANSVSESVDLSATRVTSQELEDIRQLNFSVIQLNGLPWLPRTGLLGFNAFATLVLVLMCIRSARMDRSKAAQEDDYAVLLDGA